MAAPPDITIAIDTLVCAICQDTVRLPVEATCCGSLFCERCAQATQHRIRNPSCPMCRSTPFEFHKTQFFRRVLASFPVYDCPHGCGVYLRGDEMACHEAHCLLAKVVCPYGCGLEMERVVLEEHKDDCLHKPQTCDYTSADNAPCEWEGATADYEDHILESHRKELFASWNRIYKNPKMVKFSIRCKSLRGFDQRIVRCMNNKPLEATIWERISRLPYCNSIPRIQLGFRLNDEWLNGERTISENSIPENSVVTIEFGTSQYQDLLCSREAKVFRQQYSGSKMQWKKLGDGVLSVFVDQSTNRYHVVFSEFSNPSEFRLIQFPCPNSGTMSQNEDKVRWSEQDWSNLDSTMGQRSQWYAVFRNPDMARDFACVYNSIVNGDESIRAHVKPSPFSDILSESEAPPSRQNANIPRALQVSRQRPLPSSPARSTRRAARNSMALGFEESDREVPTRRVDHHRLR